MFDTIKNYKLFFGHQTPNGGIINNELANNPIEGNSLWSRKIAENKRTCQCEYREYQSHSICFTITNLEIVADV